MKRDVASNIALMEEAETCIMSAEEKLETSMAELSKASGQITYLEYKVEDMENHSQMKNLQMFGLKEGEEGNRQLLDYVQEYQYQYPASRKGLTEHWAQQNRTKTDQSSYVSLSSKVHDIKHNGNKLSFARDFETDT